MNRIGLMAAGAFTLSACQPQARAVAWFEANPVETAATLQACQRGAHRGVECDNARAADAALKAKARQDLFRRGFE